MPANGDAYPDANTQPQPPSPQVEGHENGEGGNREDFGHNIAKREDDPPHWTRYVEAACAILLVLITGTYTYYASQQATASLTAANAAKSASDTANATLKEMQTGQGSQDTHTLAGQAVTQAIQTGNLATFTKDLASEMKDQAGQTKKIASQAVVEADAAASAADTANKSLIASNRPWVGVVGVVITKKPYFNDSGSSLGLFVNIRDINVTAKNFGPSPALNASVDVAPFGAPGKDYWRLFRSESDQRCAFADAQSTQVKDDPMGPLGQVMYPGVPDTFDTNYGGNAPEGVETTYFHLLGCVSYRDQFSKKQHHTRFCVNGEWNDLKLCSMGQQAD